MQTETERTAAGNGYRADIELLWRTVTVQTERTVAGNGYRADIELLWRTVTVQTERTAAGNGYRADRENCCGEPLPCRQREQLPGTVTVQTERTEHMRPEPGAAAVVCVADVVMAEKTDTRGYLKQQVPPSKQRLATLTNGTGMAKTPAGLGEEEPLPSH